MGRRKLPMKLISNKRARVLCFEKRKKGLKKAASELSTLCGVDIGAIIYDRDSDQSEISGSSLARMMQLCESRSAQDRRCRAYGVADYIMEETDKAKKMRVKAEKDECERLSLHQLRDLGDFLDAKIAAVRGKITSFIKADQSADHQETTGLFLNSSALQKSTGVFLNHGSQQQPMFWGNSCNLAQESLFLMADDMICGDMPDLVEASGNPMIPETNISQLDIIDQDCEGSFWRDFSLMQETFFSKPDSAVEQQQIDVCNNITDLVNIPYLETAAFMPGVIQQQWQAQFNVGGF